MTKRLTDAERQLRWLTAENERLARESAKLSDRYLTRLYQDALRGKRSRGKRQ